MAIQFQKDISQTTLLNAFNNNVVEFNSNSLAEAYKCTMIINGSSYEITPNNNGFFFNFKTVFKRLIEDVFEDSESPSLDENDLTTFIKDMSSIFLAVRIDFLVDFVNGTTETTTRNVSLLQSVVDFQQYKERKIQSTDSFAVLSELKDKSTREFNMVYFEGYPFDIQIYKQSAGNVLVTNKTNLLNATFNMPNKINRLYFSDVKTDTTINDVLPLITGMNVLEFNSQELTTVYLEKRSISCGKYLKWKNRFGGWSYWLFEDKYQQERSIDDLGYINNDFSNVDGNEYIKNIGKTSSDRLVLNTKSVPIKYRKLIESLFDSPKVYLFTGEQFSKDEDADWLSMRLITDDFIVKQFKDRWTDIPIVLEYPTRETMTL